MLEFYYNYGVQKVLGIRHGYAGLNPRVGLPPIELTPQSVSDIHEEGGTILGSSRGKQPTYCMVDFLAEQKTNILLCIGGDGTLRGAQEIAKEVQKRGLNTAVVAIPKTIDNDVMYISIPPNQIPNRAGRCEKIHGQLLTAATTMQRRRSETSFGF